jgi:DNA-binding NarL/FixJ family response regulator
MTAGSAPTKLARVGHTMPCGRLCSVGTCRILERTGDSRRWAPALSRVDLLTTREREIFGLLGAGLTNGCIAITLSIAERTVKEHIRNLLAKLGLDSRVEATIVSALYRDTVCELLV